MYSIDDLLNAYIHLQRGFFEQYKDRLWQSLPWEDNLISIGMILSDDKWWTSLTKERQDGIDAELALRYDELTVLGEQCSCSKNLDLLRINNNGRGEYIPHFDGYFYIFAGLNKDYDYASKEYGDGRVRYFYCLDREPWELQIQSYAEGAIRIDFDALCRLSSKGTVVIISAEVEDDLRSKLSDADVVNCIGFARRRDRRKRIIYGAGTDGAKALRELGEDLVQYFAESKVTKNSFCGKEVISYEQMIGCADKYKVVVSSTGYREYFEKRLKESGIEDYDVYKNKLMPTIPLNGQEIRCLYTELISPQDFQNGKRVLVVGTGGDIFALITEIRFCSGEIVGIIDLDGQYESIMGISCACKLEDIETNVIDFDVALINIEDRGISSAVVSTFLSNAKYNNTKTIDICDRLDFITSKYNQIKQTRVLPKWDVIGYISDFIEMENYLGKDRIRRFYCIDKEIKDNNDYLKDIEIRQFEEFDSMDEHGLIRIISANDYKEIESKIISNGITNYFGQHKLNNDKTLVLFDDCPIDKRTIKAIEFEYGGKVCTCTGEANDEVSVESLKKYPEKYLVMLLTESRYADQEYRLKKIGINNYIFFKWSENFPDFWLNGRRIERYFNIILNRKNLNQYKNVSIYGVTFRIYDLISEIMIQYPDIEICGIVDPDNLYKEIMGIKCIDTETALRESDCIVIIDEYGNSDIRYKLEKMDINVAVVDLYDIIPDEELAWNEDLKQYKDVHKGKRCFIIGNGPSLRSEDLDTLKEAGDICFATNDIDLMYDKTEWRPDYYVVAGIEQALVDTFEKRLDLLPGTTFTTAWYQRNTRFSKSQAFHYFTQQAEFRNYDKLNHHLFSPDISKRVNECYTVVYTAFQIAAYMGFSEMYLLGVDNGGKGYFFLEEDYDADFLSIGLHHNRAYRFERDWEEAEWYSRNHGFRIYNATRGGYLETFERVDFDSLF